MEESRWAVGVTIRLFPPFLSAYLLTPCSYDLSTGAIVAIIVGSLAAGFMIWVAWKLYNRRKEKAAGYEKQGLTGAEWEDDVPYTVKAAEEDRIAAEEARIAMMAAETAEEPRRNKRSSKSHWFNNWGWF